jgi:putative hydrolase of the HAD superfamily
MFTYALFMQYEAMRHDIGGVAYDLDGTLYPNYRLNRLLLPSILRGGRFLLAFGKARNIIRASQESKSPLVTEPVPADMAALYGGPAAWREDAADFYSVQARLAAGILKTDPAWALARAEHLVYRGWEPLFKHIKPFAGVRETLDAFRQAGLKQAVLSDFPPERKLEYMGLSGYWDALLCSERTGRLKPDPRPFEDLAAALGLPPERILYVGNSRPYDMAGAKRVGMRTALIRFPSRAQGQARGPADFIFNNYRQLLKYVLS